MKLLIAALSFLSFSAFAEDASVGETLNCFGIHDLERKVAKNESIRGRLRFDAQGKLTELALNLSPQSEWAPFTEHVVVPKDGSNFSSWFEFESKGWVLDGEAPTNAYYAGVSPVLTDDYAYAARIREVARQIAVDAPKRTLAVFSRQTRRPFLELFCQ